MHNKYLLFYILIIVSLFTSCKKQVYEIVDAEEKRLAGVYEVSHYRVTSYDHLGQELSHEDNEDFGTAEFIMNSNEGGDVFSHLIFRGPVSYTFVPSKINTGQFCGSQNYAEQMFGVYYQSDPSKKRLLIAAICPMQTLTYYVDYTLIGSRLEFFTRVIDPLTGNQMFYEYILNKK